jgi:endoglucanase
VGEFGAAFKGPKSEAACRLQSLDDQIAIFEERGAHWTIWTYKDIGIMSLATVAPDSAFMKLMRPVQRAKRVLGVDAWLNRGTLKTPIDKSVDRLAAAAERAIGDKRIDHHSNRIYLAQAVQSGYFANLMQPAFAARFQGMTETQIDKVMQSFALKNCRVHGGLVQTLEKYWRAG